MKIFYMEQGSPEWFKAHIGVPSASNFDRIMTGVGRKKSGQQDDYIAELIAGMHAVGEIEPPPYVSAAMRAGAAREDEARNWYCMHKECKVERVGFCTTDDDRFGCSPDGLVGDEGVLELKCPWGKTQTKYHMKGGGLPPQYAPQVHGELIVTGRAWVDFASYCPGLPAILVRVVPDDYTLELKTQLELFYEKFQAQLKRIRRA